MLCCFCKLIAPWGSKVELKLVTKQPRLLPVWIKYTLLISNICIVLLYFWPQQNNGSRASQWTQAGGDATQWWKEPLGSFCTQMKHWLGRRTGKKEALGDSCDILFISGAEVTEIWRYRSPSCWNIQLSLTSTIYELAAGSAGFWKVSEVLLFCWITMKTSQLVAIIIMTSLPALCMSHGG